MTVYTPYYSSRRSINQSRSWSRNQNVTRFQSNIKLGPVAHIVLVALMVVVLGLIYLTQATKTTSYDYQADNIDSQIASLSDQKSDLEVENARLQSLQNVKNSDVAKSMTTPVDTNYISE